MLLVLSRPSAANDAIIEARFVDHCLGKTAEAEALYERALRSDPPLSPKERAEAQFRVAHARVMAGSRESAAAILEKIAEGSGEASLGSWPERARLALERLAAGGDPFEPRPAGEGTYALEAAAVPMLEVLRDLGERTGLSFALDRGCPESWTISAALGALPVGALLDRLAGRGRWRRIGEAVLIGEVARDGSAFERRFSWADVRDGRGRALGAFLCTKRVNLNLPGVSLSESLALIEKLGVPIRCDPELKKRTVRLVAKDLRADSALDLLAIPAGLEWTVVDGAVDLRARKERGR